MKKFANESSLDSRRSVRSSTHRGVWDRGDNSSICHITGVRRFWVALLAGRNWLNISNIRKITGREVGFISAPLFTIRSTYRRLRSGDKSLFPTCYLPEVERSIAIGRL